MSDKRDIQPPRGACPACGRPAQHRFRPFCSSRCADADLGRWLGGRYRIPVTEGGEVGDAEADDTD